MIESLLFCHFHILVGIFHYRTWLVYSNDGLPQNALGLRDQASWMHTHLVYCVELSYIYSSSGSVAWQSLLLALTSIDGHLHSPLISHVNVRLSPFLSFHATSIIIFYSTHSAMSIARAHILHESWKSLKRLSMKQLLGLSSGLCMMGAFLVTKMNHGQAIWFCRDKLSLAMLFW